MTLNQSFARYPSLKNAVVLITGGASGIGAAMVEHFRRQGSLVAFLDLDDQSANELIARLGSQLPAPVFVHCDLTDIRELRSRIAQIEKDHGPIRVLVNNAANDDRH